MIKNKAKCIFIYHIMDGTEYAYYSLTQ